MLRGMKTGSRHPRLARFVVSAALLALGAIGAGHARQAGQAGYQQALKNDQALLARQRAQTDALKARVGELEKQAGADRDQIAQRDRKIAELKQKLAALQPGKPAAASPPSQAPHGARH